LWRCDQNNSRSTGSLGQYRESRYEALKVYHPSFQEQLKIPAYFNLQLDTVVLGNFDSVNLFLSQANTDQEDSIIVRHLAISVDPLAWPEFGGSKEKFGLLTRPVYVCGSLFQVTLIMRPLCRFWGRLDRDVQFSFMLYLLEYV